MIALTKKEMKRIDDYTALNITPSIELMENAGNQMAKIILDTYSPKRVLLLCGSKGNGGDAFVVGRCLINNGVSVDAYLINRRFSSDCEKNYNLFKGNVYDELPKLDYDLIVDGLIGIGLNSDLSDEYVDVINKVNSSKINIVALDIPSGINATTGISHGAFVKSDLCITVEYPKTGLYLESGLDSYKRLEVISIGMIKPTDIATISDEKIFKGLFRERPRNSNKGSYGKASVVGGSLKYSGASLLSYNALHSFMMGVGYESLYIPKCIEGYYKLLYPELIVKGLTDIDGHIAFNEEELKEIMKNDSISIGMGCDVSEDLYKVIKYLLKNYEGTLIIDADGLNTIFKYDRDIFKNKHAKCIITPHIGEFVRLTGLTKKEVMLNTIELAKSYAKDNNVVLILKSASSIITDGESVILSPYGNTALAKAGSGDTLSGILSGVCAYVDGDLITKASLGSYILGKAAELIDIPEECATASYITNYIPKVIKNLKLI